MRTQELAAATCATLLVALAAPWAHASGDDWGLNGTFRAQSNGNWAQTNDSYRGEQTVLSTWTINSTCTNPTDCTGHISSDQGWSASISQISGLWNIKRTITGWVPCPDGTKADGQQNYRFYPVNAATAQQDPSQSNIFAGIDETKGPSGACGINKPLVVSMPFKLTRIS